MNRRILLAAVAGIVGCAQQPPAAAPVVAVVVNAPVLVREVAVAPAPRTVPEPVVLFPPDLAGGALPKVVAPTEPPPPAVARFGTTPAERTPPAALLTPDPPAARPAVAPAPVPLPQPTPTGLKPTAPAERVPPDLGFAVQPPKLPDTPAKVEKARDVNLPPPLPAQARRASDRVPLDDPTAEIGNGLVVGRPAAVGLPPAGFVKQSVPDPFELAEQVRPRALPAEPGLAPVTVTPPRP